MSRSRVESSGKLGSISISGGVQQSLGWGWQDFAAVIDVSLTITGNSNGSDINFDSTKIVSDTAVVVRKSNTDSFAYSGSTSLFSTKISVSSHTGASVTLNAIPHSSWGDLRVYYLYNYGSLPKDYTLAPSFIRNTNIVEIDNLFITEEEFTANAATKVHSHTESDITDLGSYADETHSHTESDITDLEHDAVKIAGVEIDDTDIGDAKVLAYDEASDSIVYAEVAAGSADATHIQGVEVDDTDIGDGKILKYNATSGKLEYETDATSAGGSVSISGTPANNQLAVWTNSTTIEGDANLTWDGVRLFPAGSGGTGALCLGSGTSVANAAGSVVIGYNHGSYAGVRSTRVGYQTGATMGQESVAIGYATTSGGLGAVAIGRQANAGTSNYAMALGSGSGASNTDAIAIGRSSSASGSTSLAIGLSTVSSGGSGSAIGYAAQNSGTQGMALGSSANCGHNYSQAIGYQATTTATYQIMLGGSSIVDVTSMAPFYMSERAAALTDKAGFGQLWVKNTTPCELWFTDDTGTDTQIV